MNAILIILVVLLVLGFALIFTRHGRTLFDVAIFIILLFLLWGGKVG